MRMEQKAQNKLVFIFFFPLHLLLLWECALCFVYEMSNEYEIIPGSSECSMDFFTTLLYIVHSLCRFERGILIGVLCTGKPWNGAPVEHRSGALSRVTIISSRREMSPRLICCAATSGVDCRASF